MNIYVSKTDIVTSALDTKVDINGCLNIGNKLYTPSTNTRPIFYHTHNENGIINSGLTYLNIFPTKNISFLGQLCNGIGAIEKNTFKIMYFESKDSKDTKDSVIPYKYITIGDSQCLKELLIAPILCSKKCICKNPVCYTLSGFFLLCDTIFFLISHNHGKRCKHSMLYLLKAKFDSTSLQISRDVKLSGIYNLLSSCKSAGISLDKAKRMSVSGFGYNGTAIYLLTHTCNTGYIWTISYATTIDFIGSELNIAKDKCRVLKLKNKPRGITHLDACTLFVMCENQLTKCTDVVVTGIPYYILKMEK